MTDAYAALREAAEKATPEPWANGLKGYIDHIWDEGLTPEQTAYIAAASPDVVLGLLDTIAELEKEEAEHLNVAVLVAQNRYQKRIDALREMLAEHMEGEYDCCIECGGYLGDAGAWSHPTDGHKPGCRLAALLAPDLAKPAGAVSSSEGERPLETSA